MKITGEIDKWLPANALQTNLNDSAAVFKSMYCASQDMRDMGWVKIGRFSGSLELCIDANGINAAQVAHLQEQLRDMSAKFEAGKTEILRRISQLQAIDYTPTEVQS